MASELLFSNLKSLVDDMKNRSIVVCVFPFTYKSVSYSVIVSRYIDKSKKINKYALAKLVFIKNNSKHDTESWEANSNTIFIPNIKTFRYFFEIELKGSLYGQYSLLTSSIN